MDDALNSRHFSEKSICARDFILMSYSDSHKYLTNDLVGCSGDKRSIVVYKENKRTSEYEVCFCKRLEKDAEICTIIPADYDSSGNISYLIVSRTRSGHYANIIYFHYKDHDRLDTKMHAKSVDDIGETASIPLLFALRSMETVLLLQDRSGTHICKYDKSLSKCTKIQIHNSEMKNLHHLHTSGFIDVTGNLLPDLVLEFEEDGNRIMKIFSLDNYNCLEYIESLLLPKEIGPIAFADFNKSCLVDIAYVSKEGDDFYLNVVYNLTTKSNSKRIYDNSLESEERFVRQLISTDEKGYEPIVLCDETGMPSGLFVVDLFCDSVQHIVLTMKNKDCGKFRILLMKNNGRGQFSLIDNMFGEISRHGLISISFSDILFAGRENLIVNFRDSTPERVCMLQLYKNNLSKNNYYFSSLTCGNSSCSRKDDSFGPPVPGVSYRYKILENNIVLVGHQLSQSTFPHLQHQYVFFGLGPSSFYLIDLEGLGPLSFGYNAKRIEQKVIPNSKIVLYKEHDGSVCMALNLSPGIQIRNILTTILLVSSLLLLILIGFFIRRRKRERRRIKAERMVFDFRAL